MDVGVLGLPRAPQRAGAMTAVTSALNLVPRVGGDRTAGPVTTRRDDTALRGGCPGRDAGSASTSGGTLCRWRCPSSVRRAGVVHAHRACAYRTSPRAHWRRPHIAPHASYGKYGTEIFVDDTTEAGDGDEVESSMDDLNLVNELVDQDAIDAQLAAQAIADREMLEKLEKSQWDGLEELEDIIEVRGYDPKAISAYFWRHPGQLARRTAEVVKAIATIGALLQQKNYEDLVPTIESLGPTYVKFGQALASRSDLVGEKLAAQLERLQDEMEPAPIELARAIVREECPKALPVLADGQAIAAASLSQVYRGTIDGIEVAVKVQRPGIAARVAADAAILRTAARVLEITQGSGMKARAVDAVDEFASRIFEEMDFVNEEANIRKFDGLYGPRGTNRKALPPPGYVRVPGLIPKLPATRRVLIMEWLDGQRVMSLVSNRNSTDEDDEVADTEDGEGMEECAPMTWDEKECARKAASLPLIELGIRCTLSQLIETGVMHADPHGGNLLRLRETGELAYLDFGLVSEIPPTVRDGLVAAVTLLVFDRDYEAVAGLFGELMLVPTDVIENPYQFAALTEALREAAEATLSYPDDALGLERGENETEEEARLRRAKSAVPDVRFDQLLGALLALVPKYRFLLPPYFLNNARALGTLEGMARTADPNFNILAIVYPFAVKRLLQNPTGSPVLRRVLRQLISNKRTGRMSLTRLKLMVEDAAALTGVSRFAIMRSAMQTSAGWRLAVESVFAGAFWCASQVMGAVFFVTGVTWMRNAWGRFIYRLNRDIDEDDMTPSRVGSVF